MGIFLFNKVFVGIVNALGNFFFFLTLVIRSGYDQKRTNIPYKISSCVNQAVYFKLLFFFCKKIHSSFFFFFCFYASYIKEKSRPLIYSLEVYKLQNVMKHERFGHKIWSKVHWWCPGTWSFGIILWWSEKAVHQFKNKSVC